MFQSSLGSGVGSVINVFVGHFVGGVRNAAVGPAPHVHPSDFYQEMKRFENLGCGVFTNNPAFVDLFDHDQVVIVGADGSQKKFVDFLSDEKYEELRGEFSPGELWFLVDSSWSIKNAPV